MAEEPYRVTFYGQLLRIFRVVIPASAVLNLTEKTVIFMAEIKSCDVEWKHNLFNIHYYKCYKTPGVVAIKAIQCLVGRVKVGEGRYWAIIDRSGTLSQAEWDPSQE